MFIKLNHPDHFVFPDKVNLVPYWCKWIKHPLPLYFTILSILAKQQPAPNQIELLVFSSNPIREFSFISPRNQTVFPITQHNILPLLRETVERMSDSVSFYEFATNPIDLQKIRSVRVSKIQTTVQPSRWTSPSIPQGDCVSRGREIQPRQHRYDNLEYLRVLYYPTEFPFH